MSPTPNVAAFSPKTSTGGVLYGPLNAVKPTDASTALATTFKPLGYIGKDGIQPSGDTAKKTDLDVWGGEVVATVVENRSVTRFKFILHSIFDVEAAKFVFGAANVVVVPATASAGTKISIQVKGDNPDDCCLIFEQRFGGKKAREVIPYGSSVVLNELPRTHKDLGGYEVEVTCLPDSNGVRSYRYLENDDQTG